MAGLLGTLKKKKDELLAGLNNAGKKAATNYKASTGKDLTVGNVAKGLFSDIAGFVSGGNLGSKNVPTYRIADQALQSGRRIGSTLEQSGYKKSGQAVRDATSLLSGSTRIVSPYEWAGNIGIGDSNSRIKGTNRERTLQDIGQTAAGVALTAPLAGGTGLAGKVAAIGKNTAFGTGLGATIGGISAAATGQNIGQGIKEGALSGLKNSYILPVTNTASNAVIGQLGKIITPFSKLTPEAIAVASKATGQLAKAGQYGSAAKNALAVVGKSALVEGLRSPLETAAFALDDKSRLDTDKTFSQRYKERFGSDLAGNVVFGGGSAAVGQAGKLSKGVYDNKKLLSQMFKQYDISDELKPSIGKKYNDALGVMNGYQEYGKLDNLADNLAKRAGYEGNKAVIYKKSLFEHMKKHPEFLDGAGNLDPVKASAFIKNYQFPQQVNIKQDFYQGEPVLDNQGKPVNKLEYVNNQRPEVTVIKKNLHSDDLPGTSSVVTDFTPKKNYLDNTINKNTPDSLGVNSHSPGEPPITLGSSESPLGGQHLEGNISSVRDSANPMQTQNNVNEPIIPSNQAKINTSSIDDDYLDSLTKNDPQTPLVRIKAEADMDESNLWQPSTEYSNRKVSQTDKLLNPLKNLTPEDKAIFDTWQSSRLNSTAKTNQLAQNVDEILGNPDPQTAWKLTQYIQDPTPQTATKLGLENPEQYQSAISQIRNILDTTYSQLKQATGQDGGYLENYLPQMWKETDEQVQQIAKKAGIKPSYLNERIIPDYQTGVALGLTPKYSNPAQLVADYFAKTQRAIGNHQLVTTLIDKGLLQSGYKPNNDWSQVQADAFKQQFGKNAIYAPKQVAEVLNNIFDQTDAIKILEKGYKFSKGVQNVKLSAGVPMTPVNSFALGNLAKELTAGNFGALKAYGLGFTRKGAENYFKQADTKQAVDLMTQNGIRINTDFDFRQAFTNIFDDNPTLKQQFGTVWKKGMEDATFQRFLPINQIEFFKKEMNKAIKNGMSEQDAAAFSADVTKKWMGLFDDYARNKNVRNTIGTIFFAPTFREGMVNFWTNLVKSVPGVLKNTPETRNQRNFLIGTTLTYGLMTAANKVLTGHYMHENKSGKTLELEIPNSNGTSTFIPLLPTYATLPRNTVEAGVAVGRGDFAEAGQKASSYLSMPLQTGGQILSNRDYFGREIYDPEAGLGATLRDTGLHLIKNNAHPVISEPIEVAQGRKTPTQAAAAVAELPLRFGRSTDTAQLSNKEFETYQNLAKSGGNAQTYASEANELKRQKQAIKNGTDPNASWWENLWGNNKVQASNFVPSENEQLRKTQREVIREKIKTLDQTITPQELTFAYLYDIEQMPDTNRYENSKRSKAFYTQYGKVMEDEYLTDEQKQYLTNQIAEQIASGNIDSGRNKLEYYQIAKENVNDKTLYIYDWLEQSGINLNTNEGHEALFNYLVMGREKVNGSLLAADTVVENLYQDGLISKDERDYLKKLDWNEVTGEWKIDASSSGKTKKSETQKAREKLATQLRSIKISSPAIPTIKITAPSISPVNFAPIKISDAGTKPNLNTPQINTEALIRIANS